MHGNAIYSCVVLGHLLRHFVENRSITLDGQLLLDFSFLGMVSGLSVDCFKDDRVLSLQIDVAINMS